MKKPIEETIHEQLLEKAKIMCEKYCKYYDQYLKDQEKYDADNPTYHKRCSKCPMIEFYN